MSFKLRGTPEWLTSVKGDKAHTGDWRISFTDGETTFFCRGKQWWVGNGTEFDGATKSSLDGDASTGFSFTYNSTVYHLERLAAYKEVGGVKSVFPYTFSKNYKNLDEELNKFYGFIKSQGADSGSSSAGRPYVVLIGAQPSVKNQMEVDKVADWVKVEGEETYRCRITWADHRKGYIKSTGNYYPDEAGWDADKALIVPQVKTYSLATEQWVSGELIFEEVYDSAAINVHTGEVIVSTEIINYPSGAPANTPLAYLVLIY